MTTKDRPRFDLAALKSRAGEKSYARGEAYYRDGQVTILSIDSNRVLAQVAGTEDYRTEVTGQRQKIGGECSCPAFDDSGFCKHMVATALAANTETPDAETNPGDAVTRIRDHLKAKGVGALVQMIVDMAERDLTLFRRLDLASASVNTDGKTLERRLTRMIDSATQTPGYVPYREAGAWAAGIHAALDALDSLLSGPHAGLALRLVERTIDRIEENIEQIDDSDGHGTGLLERSLEIHVAAARASRTDPVALARNLFNREMQDDWGTFRGCLESYEDVLGAAGQAEYRRLAMEAWAKLPPRPAGGSRAQDGIGGNYHALKNILDVFAERENDVAARIALRAKDLSSSWNYLELAEFCLAQGREQEALRYGEEGLWVFEGSRSDHRLLFFTADLLCKAGRKADAETQLWKAFQNEPGRELYARLRKIGGKTAGARAIEFLRSRLTKETPTPWHYPADLLISILADEKLWDEAWKIADRHEASPGMKHSLAKATERTHPQRALDVYVVRIDQLANAGGNPAYAEAADLVTRVAQLRPPAEHTAYVADLKQRFRAKRNLMKLLA